MQNEDLIALCNYIIYQSAKFLVDIWKRVRMTFKQNFHITRTRHVQFVEVPVLNAFERVSTWPLTESYMRYYRAIKSSFCIIFPKINRFIFIFIYHTEYCYKTYQNIIYYCKRSSWSFLFFCGWHACVGPASQIGWNILRLITC